MTWNESDGEAENEIIDLYADLGADDVEIGAAFTEAEELGPLITFEDMPVRIRNILGLQGSITDDTNA